MGRASDFLQQMIQEYSHANVILAANNSQLTSLEALHCLSDIDRRKVNICYTDEYITQGRDHDSAALVFPNCERKSGFVLNQ